MIENGSKTTQIRLKILREVGFTIWATGAHPWLYR